MANKKPLEIDMIASSALRDSQGELLSIEGADISELELGRGRINADHGKGFYNCLGTVTGAKKIMKAEDCENERHEYYWNKIKAPYIYVKARLFDNEDHPHAKAAAAIIRNIHKTDLPLKMKSSVEGGVVARGIKDPSLLARTKIHSVALTFTPANNATLVEPLNLDKTSNWQSDLQLIKSVMHLAETNIPSFRHIVRDASAAKIQDNIQQINRILLEQGKQPLHIPHKKDIIEKALEDKVINNISKIHDMVASIAPPSEPMDKGIKEAIVPGLAALSIAGSSPTQHKEIPVDTSKAPVVQQQKPTDHPTVYRQIASEEPILGGIGEAETSGGVNVTKHPVITNPNSMNYGHKAGGIFGMMPKQGVFVLKKDPKLADKYPDLAQASEDIKNNHKIFTEKFNSDPQAAADFAKSALQYLKNKTKNTEMAVYAWNHGLKGAWEKYKQHGMDAITGDSYVRKVMSHIGSKKHKQKQPLTKALMAGYGGAGAPTSMIGGSVMQSESLDTNPKFKYITCDSCGKEQIHAKHQVKCRDCGNSFSFEKLYNVLQGTK